MKLFYSTYFWEMFVFVFIEVNVRGQVKKAFELNALFLQIHSSGSLWLLNAVFVITDSSRRMDWPWRFALSKKLPSAPLRWIYGLHNRIFWHMAQGAWYPCQYAINWSVWTSLVFLQYFKVSLCYGKLYMQK